MIQRLWPRATINRAREEDGFKPERSENGDHHAEETFSEKAYARSGEESTQSTKRENNNREDDYAEMISPSFSRH